MSQGSPIRKSQQRRVAVIGGIACAILAAGVWCIAYAHAPGALTDVDAQDYAQMARQLERGEGFTSFQTFPYILRWLHLRDLSLEPPWPVLTRFPLPIVAEALAMRLVGATHLSTVVWGGIFGIGTAVMLFLLILHLYGTRSAAFATAAAIALPDSIGYSVSGLTQPGAAFFIAAVAWMVCRIDGHRDVPVRSSIALGALLGLAIMQRSNLIVLAPALVVSLVVSRAHLLWRALACATAAGAFTMSPWLLRSYIHFPSDGFSLGPAPTRMFALGLSPLDPFLHFPQPDGVRLIADNFSVLVLRALSAFDPTRWPEIFGWELALLIPLLAVCGCLERHRPAASIFALLATAFALNAALFAMTIPMPKYAQPFQPLAVALLVGAALARLGKRPGIPLVAASGCAVAALFAFSSAVIGRQFETLSQIAAQQPAVFARLARQVPAGTVVASEMSWAVAWKSDRPAVRFVSKNARVLFRIDTYIAVGALLVSPEQARSFRQLPAAGRFASGFREVNVGNEAGLWVRRANLRGHLRRRDAGDSLRLSRHFRFLMD